MKSPDTAQHSPDTVLAGATEPLPAGIAAGRARRAAAFVFAAAVFLSALLLFQVQPLSAKAILPWYGGTPAVWTTCMLFFLTGLFGGYAYAHLLVQRLSPRVQGMVHLALLAAALAMLPVVPAAHWKPLGSEPPIPSILAMLTVHVGLPFFALSATTPLLQRWFTYVFAGQCPYRLYALSNAGSLLALLSYPFLFEPAFSIPVQSAIWSGGLILFAVLCTVCVWWVWTSLATRSPEQSGEACDPSLAVRPTPGITVLWFLLAMAGSVMLLATTNQVCLDVAAVPFLWVLPLALYLLSFILCFGNERWYSRRLFAVAFPVAMALVVWTMVLEAAAPVLVQLAVFFISLFICCMICHGELVRLKPDARHLTGFYLVVAAGGAAGGLFVGMIAPLAFSGFWELHLGIVGTCGLLLASVIRESGRTTALAPPRTATRSRRLRNRDRKDVPTAATGKHVALAPLAAIGGLATVLLILAILLVQDAMERFEGALAVTRNFYGVLRVIEFDPPQPSRRQIRLIHGRILHGMQFVAEPLRREPTAYYGRDSGAGIAIEMVRAEARDRPEPKRVGLVGLGVGTLAAFAGPGDVYRFYEIDPDVVRLAREYFTYLDDCRGEVEIVLGDARLSLEREPPQEFDVLLLDAFSSDAIPVHLVTAEAFEVYLRHLRPDGVMAMHISSRHFDLAPVLAGLASRFGLVASLVTTIGDDALGTFDNRWVLLTRADSRHASALNRDPLRPNREPIVWTDSYSNPFGILMTRNRSHAPREKP